MGAPVLITKQEWTVELGARVDARRVQIPLKLAYALSIHKSQGMTIDLLDISMAGIFEFGQAYVALSRARSLLDVRLTGPEVDVEKMLPNERVLEFYKKASAA